MSAHGPDAPTDALPSAAAGDGPDDQLRCERLLTEVSANLIAASPEDVRSRIHDGLRRLLTFFDADRCALLERSGDGMDVFIRASVSRPGFPVSPPDVRLRANLPWYTARMLAGAVVRMDTLADLPPEAALEREGCLRDGVRSLLAIPIEVGSRWRFHLSVATFHREHVWPPSLIPRLRLLGAMFANTFLRARADLALRESEQRYRELFEHAHDGIYLVDVTPEGRFVVAGLNPAHARALERVSGIHVASVLGRPVDETLPTTVAMALVANLRKCIAAGGPISYQAVGEIPTGRWVLHTTLIPVRDTHGRIHRIIGMVRDVTEQVTAEDALRESEARFRQLADNIHEVFWITNTARTEIQYISPRFEQVWGRSCASLIASPKSWMASVHPADRDRVAAARDLPGNFDETFRIVRPDGTLRWIRSRSFLVHGPGGEAVRVVGIAEDITRLVQAEEQLRHGQKMEAVGRLAGGVAHDFNNYLSVILMFAGEIGEALGRDHPRRGELDEIVRAASGAATLTRQLLAFSRRQVLQVRVLDLNEVVTHAEPMLRRLLDETADLELALTRPLRPVRADPGQMEQVLLNLAVNARDAMPDGGRVRVATTNADPDEDFAREHPELRPGPCVRLTVTDTGVGMDGETRARIFEPFFTTKEPGRGTGLGLSTVFGIVQQSGGAIRVESEPGRGTSFDIFLPTAEAPATVPAAPAPEAALLDGTETVAILIADPQVRAAVRMTLRRRGYTVLETCDAAETEQVARDHPGVIHLFVIDPALHRTDGLALVERLRALRPAMKVLCVWSHTDEATVQHGWQDAGLPVLQTPLTQEGLARKVRAVLDDG